MTTAVQIAVASPLGPLTVVERDGAIVAVNWGKAQRETPTPLLARAAAQLEAYFTRGLAAFDLPLAPDGDDFQQAVWRAMRAIPRGRTRTYGDIARELKGDPRDVGAACGTNPIPILIPCHRVTAAAGALGGYSGKGGGATKRFLLELEGWRPESDLPLFRAAEG
ncbi:MAG TPA: methylated-DNA--[protein]-cysteine S-methyltransferase [Alphaproteobacteria bacterium]|jgi:methylated-DNA-[protein]-cysteine S-methyltransferase|nr:methylated-DNA--[protein]-cysteine S-methyltransferase [Alphaproteobacteria bacterium]